MRTLPLIAEEDGFALKGGTAINLFVRNMPRLSVDIDLTYLPVLPCAESRPKEAILSLEVQPNRCPVTRRRDKLRHLLYGHNPHTYRVIYRVLENQKQVEVLHIRHGARRKLKTSDLA